MLENGFLIPCGTISFDLGWIGEGRKLTDFEQKPWAIAHAFEQGGFSQVLEIAPNSLKLRLSAWKWISNTLRDYLCRFGVNLRGSKIDRFWAKGLGYSPWVSTGRILASPGNRSNLTETPPKCWGNGFLIPCGTICVDLGWIGEGRKLSDFEQKAWAIAHGFKQGRFWQVLKTAPNRWNAT